MSKMARRGKVFVDWLRNGRGATAIAPWSTRARPGAPVATPIGWNEIEDVRSDMFTVKNLPERLAALEADPWSEWSCVEQSITKTMRKKLG
jgi:bifunctional non-homologous end joining protein LigD